MVAGPDNLQKLLHTILNSFIDLCGCDGGSIYTLHRGADGSQVLVFESMVTRSIRIFQVPAHLQNLRFNLDETTLVGRAALRRQFLNTSFNSPEGGASPRVDQILKYETRNILSAPLMTPRGDLVGVVQLLNKLGPPKEGDESGTPGHAEFDAQDEKLFSAVAGQAALAIENSQLLAEQERLLEGFVNACVTAIEERDPVTSGHSSRVSDYTIALGQAVSRTDSGPLREITFNDMQLREIRYAAMLHDIGKISVKEQVLKKEKKLEGWELEVIKMRLKLMRTNLKLLVAEGRAHEPDALKEQIAKIELAWKNIAEANEPSVLPAAVGGFIQELKGFRVTTDEGEIITALTEEEGFKLSIQKGSLTTAERLEIERHVTNTYEILKLVPWSRGLENVPLFAYKHHEKLDGSGYPSRNHAPEIPCQSRMLTICDIYDALTADDRPYKRAMPAARALDILKSEVSHAKLDADLFQVFVDARIYEAVRGKKDAGKIAA